MLTLFRHARKGPDEGRAERLRGAELARRVAAEYGAREPFELAARAGVRVLYERWPLLTVGECEPRAGLVRVNLAALERARAGDERFSRTALARVILAHELGHLFEWRDVRAAGVRRPGGEEAAHDFAAELLGLPRGLGAYERFWRSHE